jgi:cephalosporin-C deacetylase-like acetyl esterase
MKKEVLFLVCISTAVHLFAAEPVRVSSFGYNPEDATECFQRALDSDVRRLVVDRQSGGWHVRPLRLSRPDLELTFEPGVVVRAKKGAFIDGHDTLFSVEQGGSNIVISGSQSAGFAMNRQDYADRRRYAFSTHRHALALRNCRNVTVRGITISDPGGDCIYIYRPVDTLIENVTCERAFRDGMSVIAAERLTVRNSRFVDTSGTAPNCGVDIESNNTKDFIKDVIFENCVFSGNAASGLCLHLPGLDSTVDPVSIAIRNCEMTGNGADGIVTYASIPDNPVSGKVLFENCRASGNRRSALHMTNQESRGLDFDFRNCDFDGRGGISPAVQFGNSQISEDFSDVRFGNCRVYADSNDAVCTYSGMSGTGVTDVRGVLKVSTPEGVSAFDLASLKEKYVPDPEARRFAAARLNLAALRPVNSAPLAKPVEYPFIRNKFTFVQYVPDAGKYKVRFKLKMLDSARKPKMTIQVRDMPGTDLGSFSTEENVFEYEIVQQSQRSNIFLFEVHCGLGALASVESVHPGQGILFNDIVNLFASANIPFYFAIPGSAAEVSAELKPEESMGAELLDGKGNVRDLKKLSRSGKVLRSSRIPTGMDETWCVYFSKIQEDGFFRLGAPAVPIATTDPAAVLMSGKKMASCEVAARLTGKEWLRGKTDKDAVSYKVGEPIVFTVTVEDVGGLPKGLVAEWVRTGDDGKIERGTWDLRAPLVCRTSLDRAGFVRLCVEVKDAAGIIKMSFDGGAGADIDSLRQTKETPADFLSYLKRRLAELAAVPMTATLNECRSPDSAVKVFAVKIPCAGKRPSTAYVSIPVAKGKYPALVHFSGYGSSWSVRAAHPPREVSADKIEMWVSAHGFELGRESAYYAALQKESGSNGYSHGFDPAENAKPETSYFGGMLWRVVRAVEYVKTLKEWNGTDLTVEGGSQGALQSIWAAALVPGVTKADIYIPWNCNMAGTTDGRNHGDWYVKWAPGLDYYDPVNMACLIPETCKVVISRAGLGDYISPPSGVAMFYNNLKCPKKCLWLQGSRHGTIPKIRDYSFRREGM